MMEPASNEPKIEWRDCRICGEPIPYREEKPLCQDCESLSARYPDGFPPEVDAAILLARTLRQLFVEREGFGYRKSVISELERVADNAESVRHHLEMLEIHLKGIEDRLEEISDEAQKRSLG